VSQLAAFVLTLAVELPWYVAGLVALRLAGWRRAVGLGVLVNALSHPVLWCFLAPHPTLPHTAVAEGAVCAFEALLLFAAIRREPALLALLSVAANGCSVLIGLLVS
jgi:hypothetical protein